MCTALRCIDVIYKSIAVLRIGVVVLHRNLNRNAVLLSLTVNNLWIQRFFTLVQICYKFTDTTLVVEYFFFLGVFSLISEDNAKSFGKESHLTKTLFQDIIIINSFLKDFLIRQECNSCS